MIRRTGAARRVPDRAGASSASAPFRGFGPESFQFFERLARNNRTAWFHQHRADYDQHVAGALRALFHALAPAMLLLDPEFEHSGKTGKNFSRINRDIRFSKDKSPYRRNLYLYFGNAYDPRCDGHVYVGLSADGVTVGCAVYHQPGGTCERVLKPRVARAPAVVERTLRRLRRRYEIYWHGTEKGEWLKYQGYPREPADWKRLKALIVRRLFPPMDPRLASPRFAAAVIRIFRDLWPWYAFTTLSAPAHERRL